MSMEVGVPIYSKKQSEYGQRREWYKRQIESSRRKRLYARLAAVYVVGAGTAALVIALLELDLAF
jgi:hypothetical protein